jgi:hypothetical protein
MLCLVKYAFRKKFGFLLTFFCHSDFGESLSHRKDKFPLARFVAERQKCEDTLIRQRLEIDAKLEQMREEINRKRQELLQANKEAHNVEERIRKRKLKVYFFQ